MINITETHFRETPIDRRTAILSILAGIGTTSCSLFPKKSESPADAVAEGMKNVFEIILPKSPGVPDTEADHTDRDKGIDYTYFYDLFQIKSTSGFVDLRTLDVVKTKTLKNKKTGKYETTINKLPVALNRGRGNPFQDYTAVNRKTKKEIKYTPEKTYREVIRTNEKKSSTMQWYCAELTSQNELKPISMSYNPKKSTYAASVLKVPDAVAFVDLIRKGNISKDDVQKMLNMIAGSDNKSWGEIRAMIDGVKSANKNTGHAKVGKYFNQPHMRKYGLSRNGKNMTAQGSAELMKDIFLEKLPGSEMIKGAMITCHTGGNRVEKYLPQDVVVASKTGSWGNKTGSRGKWNAEMSMIFLPDGRKYILTAFVSGGSNRAERIAALAGGLFQYEI